ncbi:hypothetical protein GYA25_00060, partial [Candidatus Woesearchaeota archaeon]|nr:hypothetical protein [Candidatus Woesearchaeota archaeon]
MVYKKYIKKGGKIFGPYLYENYRVNGVTKTRYLGPSPTISKSKNLGSNKKRLFFSLILFLAVISFAFFFYFPNKMTGKATVDLLPSSSLGEIIKGSLIIKLKTGELIPADSTLKVSLGNQEKIIPLSSILNINLSSGNYYLENVQLTGNGDGYGFAGEKISYPTINFILLSTKNFNTLINETLNETIEENTFNKSQENIINTSIINLSDAESDSEKGVESVISITGKIIGNNNVKEITGSVSKNNPFKYTLAEDETVEILKGSVRNGENILNDNLLEMSRDGNNIIITTEYKKFESGFGEEFLGVNTKDIEINISKINLTTEQGQLKIILEKDNQEILSISKEINLDYSPALQTNETNKEGIVNNNPEPNETLPFELNLTNETSSFELNLTNETSSFELNLTNQTTLIDNLTNETTNLTIQTIQYQAIIGEPVRWKKIVNKSKEENITIELPKETFNITVNKIEKNKKERVKDKNIQVKGLTRNITADYQSKSNNKQSLVFQKFFAWLGLLGNVIEETVNTANPPEKTSILDNSSEENITTKDNLTDSVQIEIMDNSTNLEIEYYTEAPTSTETNLSEGKQIVISAPDELNYTNILAYTGLNQKIPSTNQNKINLYWITNETNNGTLQNSLGKVKISFTSIDENKDGFIDYIEWIVPHLSNQTYELIIKTKDAEHLYENKTLIEDVYDYIKTKDNNWTTIPNNHYLRLQFETNLTSSRDITIYAKSSNENTSTIEVYERNQTQLIATFENITNE